MRTRRTSTPTTARRLADGGLVLFAGLRVVMGAAAVLSPRHAPRPWIGDAAALPGTTVMSRAAGGRDVALGVGVLGSLARRDPAARSWLLATTACDLGDIAATVAVWRSLPPWKVLVVAGAGAASALAAAELARPS